MGLAARDPLNGSRRMTTAAPQGRPASLAGILSLALLGVLLGPALALAKDPVATVVCEKGATDHVAFSPDGKLLAAAGAEDGVKLYDAATRKLQTTLPWKGLSRLHLTFTPDSKFLVTNGSEVRNKDQAGGPEQVALVWDLRTKKKRT